MERTYSKVLLLLDCMFSSILTYELSIAGIRTCGCRDLIAMVITFVLNDLSDVENASSSLSVESFRDAEALG